MNPDTAQQIIDLRNQEIQDLRAELNEAIGRTQEAEAERDEAQKEFHGLLSRYHDQRDRYDKLEAWAIMRDAGHDQQRTELNALRPLKDINASLRSEIETLGARGRKLILALEYYSGAPWVSTPGVAWHRYDYAEMARKTLEEIGWPTI